MSLFYEDVGDGPSVVLVHGWPLSCRFWELQIGPLVEAGHRVICYDRRGFGRSSRPWHGYDLDTFTADLAGLIEGLDLTGLTLVGFSTGCAESVAYAAASGRVARLVLGSPVLYANPLAHELRTASKRHRIPMLDDLLFRFFAVDGHSALDEPTRQYLLRQAAEASPKGTADSLAAWAAADPRPELARVTVPTLIIQGEGDAFVPPEDSGTRVARAVAGSSLVTIPAAPHGAPLTHFEQWNELMLEFLAS
ncbi:alpha/beta fold hydrolase [Nonomuraea jiangxiensis]|uniref:Pimeloyl-ACP methyl ester carboxylesterase n=1 Tax=Nonomuraea jiangxiensis TaxID=633440 RepID=A0A1G8M3B4_9ACTN|nr:alpha/beta hydrolase [Nonomuraea jiangxiensis]SDI62446.1 Pimeloyl-ACP methyl ester carboxylesterase [Nonomuraea jiangxiensis]